MFNAFYIKFKKTYFTNTVFCTSTAAFVQNLLYFKVWRYDEILDLHCGSAACSAATGANKPIQACDSGLLRPLGLFLSNSEDFLHNKSAKRQETRGDIEGCNVKLIQTTVKEHPATPLESPTKSFPKVYLHTCPPLFFSYSTPLNTLNRPFWNCNLIAWKQKYRKA